MKLIRLNILKANDSGAYGTYYRLNKNQGIKVLAEDSETIAGLKRTCDWDDAKAEAYALRKAWKSGIVPKCFGVRIVQDTKSGLYYVGILMQHLGEVTAYDKIDTFGPNGQEDAELKFHAIKTNIRRELLKYGVEHNDLHEYNIMFFKGKYHAIDFGPNDVSTFKVNTPVKKIDHKLKSRANKISNLKAA